MKLPTLAQAEKVLDEPASEWIARCFEIASRIVNAGLVDGIAVFGHWRGPVAKGSQFEGKNALGFVQHGWVLLPDGRVLDPTRWVFENRKPYIYVGAGDHYDEGGNVFRESMLSSRPPEFDCSEDVFVFDKKTLPNGDAFSWLERTFNLYEREDVECPELSKNQVHWLAHRHPRSMKGHAKAIYAALAKLGLLAHVPIDNQRMVEQGRA